MPINERSASDVLQDIVHNIEEIVRSEIRLAKTEIHEETAKAKTAALVIGGGAMTALFAVLFLLWTIVYALSLVVPSWAAALIVGVVLSIAAAACIMTGVERFKQVRAVPERTAETIKENVEWVKQQTK